MIQHFTIIIQKDYPWWMTGLLSLPDSAGTIVGLDGCGLIHSLKKSPDSRADEDSAAGPDAAPGCDGPAAGGGVDDGCWESSGNGPPGGDDGGSDSDGGVVVGKDDDGRERRGSAGAADSGWVVLPVPWSVGPPGALWAMAGTGSPRSISR